MTTSTSTGDHHCSDILRVLARAPIALGMHSCFDPAVWHATWGAIGARRHAAQPHATDEAIARGADR
jgi:hypothetical protein